DLWNQLHNAGVAPCGLGARDTLRLEAGMNLYGQDMDEHTTPLEAGLAWTVAFEPADRQFIGRPVLDAQRTNGVPRQLLAIVLEEKGVLRSHQKVRAAGIGEGEITSGSFSPTLSVGIAFARMPAGKVTECEVEMRGKWLKARVIKAPFVKDGKANF
ncbi:MAG TPA: glycine cleavage T C-terminal barrel domain-containing protein, partial [Gammaproteobacteria bacterium]